jgi:hypothetical protein
MRKKKEVKEVKGLGVVGTWVFPHQLGGSLPQYLSRDETQALMEAEDNARLLGFIDDTEQWLCEIVIKPIRKVEKKTSFK